MSSSSRRTIMERLSTSRLSLQLTVVRPGLKLAKKIIAACEDEEASQLYTEYFNASGEEKVKKRQEMIEALAKFGIKKEGQISSALNIFYPIRNALKNITSDPLIEFFKSYLVVTSDCPSILAPQPENTNKKINEIVLKALPPAKEDSLEGAIAEMNKELPSFIVGFTIVCTEKERASAAKAITKQAFYRLLLDENLRQHVPNDVYIKARGLKSQKTRAIIEEINRIITDLRVSKAPNKADDQLQTLLRNIGIDLPKEKIQEIIASKPNGPEEKNAYSKPLKP